MEINGINVQVAQAKGSLSIEGGQDTAGAGNSSRSATGNSSSGSDELVSQTLSKLFDKNYIKDQIEQIMYGFPPFFPVGSPQRFDLIQGVKGVQEEIQNNTELPGDVKDQLTGRQLTDDSTDKEISAALEGVLQYTEGYSPDSAQSAGGDQQTGIVNIQI
jgi:hypothetical protein